MKTTLPILFLLLLALPPLVYAQEFQFRQEFDTIPVEIDGHRIMNPWTGGDGETSPAFCDIDTDGDKDYFQGNVWNRLTFYENIGTADSAIFKYRTRYFGGISIDSMYSGRLGPGFVDIDADGDFDLFSSDHEGLVHYWQNIGTAQNAQFVKITDSLNAINVPGPAHLTFTDIDADGVFDLFIGDNGGNIRYYRNTGTPQNFNFQWVTNLFQGIDVGMRAAPSFVDMDGDGDKDLFIGNEQGKIWYYRNDSVGSNLVFTQVSIFYNNIDVGDAAAPAFADLDGDVDQDMAVGLDVLYTNAPTYGDVVFYENTGNSHMPVWNLISHNYLTWDLGSFAYNHGIDIDADGDHDLFIDLQYCVPDYFAFYKNVGTPLAPSFSRITDNYQDIHPINEAAPFFTDINGDQDPDLFLGWSELPNPPYPGLAYYENIGNPRNAVFGLVTNNLVTWNFDVAVRPAFVDIDADGDKDLFVADNNSTYYFFENIGTVTQPIFATPVLHWQGIEAPGLPLCFSDIDHDGDYDLFLAGPNYNDLWFYRNEGTPQVPNMQFVTQHFFGLGVDLYCPGGIDIVDIDNDSDDDFFFSGQYGGMMFFRNITGESPVPPGPKYHPLPQRQISILPNPGNSGTTISYVLSHPQHVNLSVYNLLGSRIATLVDGLQQPGSHVSGWDAKDRASGIYLVRLSSPEFTTTQKIVVLK